MVGDLMAKYEVGKGIDEYIRSLGNLERMSGHICGQGVYEGAKVVADAVKASIQSLPVNDSDSYKTKNAKRGVTAAQKAGLIAGMGVAKMKNEGGYYNVAVGFHGYNSTVTDKYPQGQPNAMIARSVNSGSSYRQKNPFFDRAIRNSKKAAEAAMAKKIDEEINKLMK